MSATVETAHSIDDTSNATFPIGGQTKRFADLVMAILILVVVLPVFLVLAIAICGSSPGGVFFKHKRIGFRGREFHCYKFRSMLRDGDAVLAKFLAGNPEAAREWRETQKLKRDPRVTPIGRLLRISSLDELPQLINVIKGDMSLVGPRPIVTSEIERFGSDFERYKSARPGITGPWQVGGRSDCSYARRIQYDTDYVRNWSMRRDLAILAVTAKVVLERKGSY